jgi:UDP-N-acetylglucosamine--N-acetylmuramyl-(pentapeptide) pyrophosphoryl-undecaprenol N-acetylglucosamine transferase
MKISNGSQTPIHLTVLAGPTGGHLFPALAFAEAWREQHPASRIVLITGRRAQDVTGTEAFECFDAVVFLPDFPLPTRLSYRILPFLLKFAASFGICFLHLMTQRPSLCVGFGSYAAFPGTCLASWMKIPVLIHEQNLVPGKATKELLRFADCAAFTFAETVKKFPSQRSEWVGFPIRKALCDKNARMERGGNEKRFVLLVVGGSQGAGALNRLVLEALTQLPREEKNRMAVIHIAGHQDAAWIRQRYEEIEMDSQVFSFSHDMASLYKQANLAITRAGAGTIFELAYYSLPSICIPYPYAGGHQKENAAFFEHHQALIVKEEADLSASWLAETVRGLMREPERLRQMSDAIGHFRTENAAGKLVALSEELMSQGRHN